MARELTPTQSIGDLTVEDFVHVETATQASFSEDGSTIAFRSNRSGVSQGYLVDSAGEAEAAAYQLTDTGGIIYRIEWRPGRNELLYIVDDGGDEQFELHLLDADSGTTRPIAARPHVIHNFGAWCPEGRRVSYGCNQRDRRFFDVYVLEADVGEERLVLESDDMNVAGRFDSRGELLLVSRPNLKVPGDSDLLLIDLDGHGEPRRLTPHTPPASWSGACFHPSGAILTLSDEEREFHALQRIDPQSGAREYVLDFDWDIEQFQLARDGSRVAVVSNEDGYSRLAAFDVTTDGRLGDELSLPSLPRGVISMLAWRPDGGALAFTFEGPRHVADIWVVDLKAGALRQVTYSDMRGIPVDALPEPQLVRYKTFDGREIPAFYYRPSSPANSQLPCMVLVHGGPEGQSRPSLWGRTAAPTYLLSQGQMALLVPNVRGSTGYGKEYAHADDVEKRMDSVRDLTAAVDWLTSTGEIDPSRIGVMGGSYGGFMALAAITEEPERWCAAVDLFGIWNFETFLENTGPWRRKHRAREYGEDPEFLRTISPIHKADRIRSPLLIIQGDHDVRVPPSESQQIADTIRHNGGIVEYVLFEREGHGIQKLPNRLTMNRKILAFLREHLLAESHR